MACRQCEKLLHLGRLYGWDQSKAMRRDGQAPEDLGQHDPASPTGAHGLHLARSQAVAIMTAFGDALAPASFQRIVHDVRELSLFEKMLNLLK